MTDWSPQQDTYSPDRVDALVWAVSELMGGASEDYSNVDLSSNRELTKSALGEWDLVNDSTREF